MIRSHKLENEYFYIDAFQVVGYGPYYIPINAPIFFLDVLK